MPDLLEGSAFVCQNTLPRPLDGILERVTGYEQSHIEVLLYFKGQPYVYGAFPPRVRKVPLDEFLERVVPRWKRHTWTRRLGGLKEEWWQPSFPLEEWRLRAMREVAEIHLGTPYNMVATWFGCWWAKGFLHCSYYAGLIYTGGQMIDCAEHKKIQAVPW